MYMLGAKYGLRCANHGSVLCHGLRAQSMHRAYLRAQKYKFADNPQIALRAQIIDRLVCSQVQFKDKMQVSGIGLPS